MASVIEICNIALSSHCRAGSINSLNEASRQAQECKLHYPIARDFALSQAPWGFATKVRPLTLRADELFDWVYAYNYPSDCLHIDKLLINFEQNNAATGVTRYRYPSELPMPDVHAGVPHEVFNVATGDKIIAANEPDLRIKYRYRQEDPTAFSVEFTLALAALLGSMIVIPLVGAESGALLQRNALSLYTSYIQNASANNANDNYREPAESEFITVRR